jgi:hypothetical protein
MLESLSGGHCDLWQFARFACQSACQNSPGGIEGSDSGTPRSIKLSIKPSPRKSLFFKSIIPRPSHHLHNAMVTRLNPASREKMIKQGKLALSARARKQRCYEVTFDGVEPGEYVLMDPPENLRWKEDGFDWQLVHSSAWQENAYRIFRKCES